MPTGGPIGNAYTDALLDARKSGYALGAAALRRLDEAFREAAKEVIAQIGDSSNPLERDRLTALSRQLTALSNQLSYRAGQIIARGESLTVKQVVGIHAQINAALAKRYGGPGVVADVARTFDRLQSRAATVVAARASNAANFRTLITRNATSVAPAMDKMIVSSIARGVPAAKLGKDIGTLLNGGDVLPGDYDLDARDLTRVRAIRTASRMIAVTEINNAMREANISALQESPIIYAAKWQMSGRHEGLRSSPDECDELAEDDAEGLGPGMYLVTDWPLAPHPWCGCTQGGPLLYRPPSEWNLPSTDLPLEADDPL